MKKVTAGQEVTTTTEKTAYYSEYGGLPKQTFAPGMVGTIAGVNVPCVRGPRKVFHRITFEGMPTPFDKAQGHTTSTWSVALYPEEIKEITNQTKGRR